VEYDFFIAYASPDASQAEDLDWALQDLRRSVFRDRTGIEPGSAWDETLSTVLESARVVVVLISDHSRAAHYQREEIARVIQRGREKPGSVKVVPVLMSNLRPADLPYGLAIEQSIDGMLAGGTKRIAKTLNEKFPRSEGMEQRQRRNAYYALGAALRLDRVTQWAQILEASNMLENTLFLFHGSHDQNVGLFLERIQRFFVNEVVTPRRLYRVRFNIQGQTPKTGADWCAHLRDALGCMDSIETCLGRLARQQALFLILGENPLPLDRMSDQNLSGLREFVVDLLPGILRGARLQHGVSIMIPIDYLDTQPPAMADVEAWCNEADQTHLLRFRLLPPASLPSWSEVHAYLLTDVSPRPRAEDILLMKQEYERHASNPNLTFEKLARLVDRYTLTG